MFVCEICLHHLLLFQTKTIFLSAGTDPDCMLDWDKFKGLNVLVTCGVKDLSMANTYLKVEIHLI